MALFQKKKKTRACVIGLDGVPYSLVLELTERGITPSLADLLKTGHLHRMKASLPEISAVSWTDFMTGSDSGRHGIFGFTDLKPGSYALRFPNFLDVKKETLWDILGKTGKRSIVLNQPSTYPARPLTGAMVSFLKDDWDYFEFVITGTDRLHHYLWNAYADEKHRYHARFLDYYRRVDGIISRLVLSYRHLTGGDAGLYLLSDHGFCQIDQEVYLNAWLQQEGYLRFSGDSPQGLEDLAAGSVAFALDPNRVYLHLKGRFPKGTVEEGDREALKAEIAHTLEGLEFEGRRVIRRVFDADDVYSGPFSASGPDLLVLSEPGFDLKGSVKKKAVFGRTDLEGMHTWEEAFFCSEKKAEEDLKISQISPIILSTYP